MKCKHCANEVQGKPKFCNHCGKKLGSHQTLKVFAWIFVGLIAFVAYSNWATETARKQMTAPANTASPVMKIDKAPAMQADRKALIDKLVRERIFQKVEVPGNLPRVWVTPRFMALPFDDKEKFISVVYAYHFDGQNMSDAVRIFDSLSGHEIGHYGQKLGGFGLKLE